MVDGPFQPGFELACGIKLGSIYAHGGMGVLYEAMDISINRSCLVKIAKISDCSPKEAATRAQRLEREGRALLSVQHPNVVQIISIGKEQGHPFLVFPFYSGHWETLREFFRKDPRTPIQAVRELFRDILGGLAALHDVGVIHRDLKPGNILVNTSRPHKAVIIDLGIAKRTLDPDDFTDDGASPGTPSYIAPEAIAGNAYDLRADVFAVGCMLYQALHGVCPYPASNRLEAAETFDLGDAKLPKEIHDIAPALARLCEEAICIQPEKRVPSAHVFLKRLEDAFSTHSEVLHHDDDISSFGHIAEDINRAAQGEFSAHSDDYRIPSEDLPTDGRHFKHAKGVKVALIATLVLAAVVSAAQTSVGTKDETSILAFATPKATPIEGNNLSDKIRDAVREQNTRDVEDRPQEIATEEKKPSEEIAQNQEPISVHHPQKDSSHGPHRTKSSTKQPEVAAWAPTHWSGQNQERHERERIYDTQPNLDPKSLAHLSSAHTHPAWVLNRLSSHAAGTEAVFALEKPIRIGTLFIPNTARLVGSVSHRLVGQNQCRAHVTIHTLTMADGRSSAISGQATVQGMAGIPCRILGNINRRKERAVGEGLLKIAESALTRTVPNLSPLTSNVSRASQEDIREFTAEDPEAVVNANTHVDLQLDGGK